jgi:hypothetical protein
MDFSPALFAGEIESGPDGKGQAKHHEERDFQVEFVRKFRILLLQLYTFDLGLITGRILMAVFLLNRSMTRPSSKARDGPKPRPISKVHLPFYFSIKVRHRWGSGQGRR